MATTTTIVKGYVGEESSADITITNELFKSIHDVWVPLLHPNIQAASTVVTTVGGGVLYVEGALNDYVMENSTGKIMVLSTGAMADATNFEIDYVFNEPNLAWKINAVTTGAVTYVVETVNYGRIGVAIIVHT